MESKPALTMTTRQRISNILRSKAFRRIFFRGLAIVILVPLLLQIIVAYWIATDPRILPSTLQEARNVLIVTAHPDDECLFFGPAILGVLETGKKEKVGEEAKQGALLVLSTGNNYGKGELRKKELQGSCEALGIHKSRCVAVDREELQDNPKEWWNEEVILEVVEEYIKKWKIDAIITFDEGGISGHINHRAVSVAISNWAAVEVKAPPTYLLSTVALPRKYTFLGDLPLTSLSFTWRMILSITTKRPKHDDDHGDKALIANTWNSYLLTRHAFASHDSQYSWDRHLYLILSRYAWFNDLRRVERTSHAAVDT